MGGNTAVRMPKSHDITAWGETKRLYEWIQDPRCNLTESSVRHRLKQGLPPEEALWSESIETKHEREIGSKLFAFLGTKMDHVITMVKK